MIKLSWLHTKLLKPLNQKGLFDILLDINLTSLEELSNKPRHLDRWKNLLKYYGVSEPSVLQARISYLKDLYTTWKDRDNLPEVYELAIKLSTRELDTLKYTLFLLEEKILEIKPQYMNLIHGIWGILLFKELNSNNYVQVIKTPRIFKNPQDVV